jgi:CYTH domain-containing protein
LTRSEFEYEIPKGDAIELLKICELPLIEKTRYLIKQENFIWEVDRFEGENEGLIIAEIELENENQKINLPEWLGKEVSTESKYFNSTLISNPYKNWTVK